MQGLIQKRVLSYTSAFIIWFSQNLRCFRNLIGWTVVLILQSLWKFLNYDLGMKAHIHVGKDCYHVAFDMQSFLSCSILSMCKTNWLIIVCIFVCILYPELLIFSIHSIKYQNCISLFLLVDAVFWFYLSIQCMKSHKHYKICHYSMNSIFQIRRIYIIYKHFIGFTPLYSL